MHHFQPPQAVLASVKEKLASAAASNADVLDGVADILASGRGYSWVGIYLAVEDKTRAAEKSLSGNSSPASGAADNARFPETKSEMVVPVKIGTRTLGMIDVESGRASALSRQERVLLGQVAAAIARYLTTDRGKLLLRKARKQSAHIVAEDQPPKGPQSARPVKSRAPAGERSAR